MKRLIFVFTSLLFASCSTNAPKTAIDTPPEWAKSAIWYQIFVERFHNGDPSNDPRKQDIEGSYPGFVPENWAITPWTQDWYKDDVYFKDVHGKPDLNGNPLEQFSAKTNFRRYGGDLQGVIDKLDYIQSLGVNALYLNPINDSPSLHKFDARNWRHVDINLGPDPDGDKAIIASEDPTDPSTWKFTSADQLFLTLIKQAKSRGIRVILDYSWNHTGNTFWAWQDVVKNQGASKYSDWYWINAFDNPATPEDEFSYQGWFGVKTLPEIRETQKVDHSNGIHTFEGNIANEQVKQHIFNVTKRWLDPNGDGDPSDGLDGYRLDVAAEVPLGFWREYRQFVRSVNPDAYLIGEIWWQQWPDTLIDPANVLQGDVFDAVMNYRWYRSARRFFADLNETITASELVAQLNDLTKGYDRAFSLAMMNMSASHDTPRLLTSFYNPNRYKYLTSAEANPEYKIGKPDSATFERVKSFLAFQFTQPGAPQIYAGDEMGMWGSDDPHNRKPLIWPELEFEDEAGHPLGHPRQPDPVAFDKALVELYASLGKLRNDNPVLVDGDIDYYAVEDDNQLLAYARTNDSGNQVYVAFNMSDETRPMPFPLGFMASTKVSLWQTTSPALKSFVTQGPIMMQPRSASIVIVK